MRLFKRELRSVYRLYTEDEYLDGESQFESDGQSPAAHTPRQTPHDRWSAGGLLAAGLIAAVIMSVLVLVITAGAHHPQHRPPTATATVPIRGAEPKIQRPLPSSPPRPRRRGERVHQHRRIWAAPRRATAQPRGGVVVSTAGVAPDPQLEFGFER